MKKISTIAIILVFTIVFGAACSGSGEQKNAGNTGSNTTPAENKEGPAEAKKEKSGEVPTAPKAGMSPTDTLRAFSEATKSKDAARIKSFLSKDSIAMIEKSAREQKRTVEEILTESEEEEVDTPEPETRNEKINGNEATVEVKNEVLGNYDVMPFVKEEGVWKIALDKFMKDMMDRINSEQQPVPGDEPEKDGKK